MSELVNERRVAADFHWKLLTTASALALLSAVCKSNDAMAADQDTDRPTVWIELGAQMDHLVGQGDAFAPAFLAANPGSSVLQATTPLQAQRPVPFAFGEQGKISIDPQGSAWDFSVAVNYGRSSNSKRVDHQTPGIYYANYKYGVRQPRTNQPLRANFAETQAHNEESHIVLDFSAGKDVGLGMFGSEGSSYLSLGVRFAQFSSKATFDVRARPDIKIKDVPLPTFHFTFQTAYFHSYHASGSASRNFRGIGPSLSWNSSAAVEGNPHDGEIAVDWGVNAAVLFGKQKASVQHHETGQYVAPLGKIHPNYRYAQVYDSSGGRGGARSVVVPDFGGFAGVSWRVENFKASLGYRADFFFGAVDGGIDARKSETLGFYGPFASISVGLGG